MLNKKSIFFATIILISLGILARVLFWIIYPDYFFVDEASLSYAIWRDSYSSVLGGNLSNHQSAPLGFLLLTKLLAEVFGDGIRVMRFLPMLAGCGLLIMAYILCRKLKASDFFTFCFIFLLVCCRPLFYYSENFKPYSAECFFALLFLWLFLHYRELLLIGKIPYKLVAVTAASFLFSLGTLFVLAALLVFLLANSVLNKNFMSFVKNSYKQILAVAFFFAAYYVFYLGSTAISNEHMNNFWSRYYPKSLYDIPYAIFSHSISLLKNITFIFYDSQYNALFFGFAFMLGCICLLREKYTTPPPHTIAYYYPNCFALSSVCIFHKNLSIGNGV